MRWALAAAFVVGVLFSAGCDDGGSDSPPPSVAILNPTGTSTLYGSQRVVVEWAPENVTGWVLALVEFHDGAAWATVVDGMSTYDGTTFLWTVPDDLDTDAARFRVTCYTEPGDGGDKAASGAPKATLATDETPDLSIRPGTITIVSPTSSSRWMIGQDEIVEWTSQGPELLELWISDDGVSWAIRSNNIDASLESYTLSMLPWGDTCYVRLQDRDNDVPSADSDVFETAGLVNSSGLPPTLEIDGYMEFHANAYGSSVGNVDIEFSRDGTWGDTVVLYADVDPSNTNAWIPTAPAATECVVRMTSLVTPEIFIEWPFDIVEAP